MLGGGCHCERSEALSWYCRLPNVEIAAALTELDGWKTVYAGMPEPLVRQLRGVEVFRNLYNVRLMLVALLFEQAMYKDPFSDLDETYRRLFEEIMAMAPADTRGAWVRTDYVLHPVTRQNDFLGRCIAAQTYRYLTDKYGSVLDNQRTREFVTQNVFRFGARDSWQVLLERGFGDKLTADYLLDITGN